MPTFNNALPILEVKELIETIKSSSDLIAITMVSGDLLLGGLEKNWSWNDKTILLGFNTEKGLRYGLSNIVTIPVAEIANIQKIPIAEESVPRIPLDDPSLVWLQTLGLDKSTPDLNRLTVQDYPNPLALIICNHNLPIANRLNLMMSHYMECSLPTEAVPKEGIELDSDILLYVDWAFFSRQMAGSINLSARIPGVGIAKNLSPALHTEVIRRLRNKRIDKMLRKGKMSSAINEIWINGEIFIPEECDDTVIDGEEYISVRCISNDVENQIYPVLLAPKLLKYPMEFINYITSPLIFYGELLPIPLTILGENYSNALLARAIGYVI